MCIIQSSHYVAILKERWCYLFLTLLPRLLAVKKGPRKMKSTAYRQRLLCLQQQVAVLQSASRAATRKAQEQSEKHTQAQMELEMLTHRLQASKQLSQVQHIYNQRHPEHSGLIFWICMSYIKPNPAFILC